MSKTVWVKSRILYEMLGIRPQQGPKIKQHKNKSFTFPTMHHSLVPCKIPKIPLVRIMFSEPDC